MIGSLVIVLLIVVVGVRTTDDMRRKEAENILGRLPLPEASAYYDVLRRRFRRIALMRALALTSLLWIFFVFRQQLIRHDTPPPPTPPSAAQIN